MGTYNKEKYYYLMIKSNFFDNDVLKYLQFEPNGYKKIILYFKLIFKTINKDGYLIKKVPYTIKELSTETNHSEELINAAIDYFMDTGMIEKRDKYLCQLCLKDKVYTYDNLQVHHIIPISKDYNKKLDSDNLITLCRMHHKQEEKGIISKEELYELLEVPRRVGNPKV